MRRWLALGGGKSSLCKFTFLCVKGPSLNLPAKGSRFAFFPKLAFVPAALNISLEGIKKKKNFSFQVSEGILFRRKKRHRRKRAPHFRCVPSSSVRSRDIGALLAGKFAHFLSRDLRDPSAESSAADFRFPRPYRPPFRRKPPPLLISPKGLEMGSRGRRRRSLYTRLNLIFEYFRPVNL